jgi:hypothetical protein
VAWDSPLQNKDNLATTKHKHTQSVKRVKAERKRLSNESILEIIYPRALSLVSARIMKLSKSRRLALARPQEGVAIVLRPSVSCFCVLICRSLLVSFMSVLQFMSGCA